MSAKKKRQDSLKAKEKKQKIIAAVGGVLLVGLLAFQVPRVMKQMNRGNASAASVPQTVSTPTTTPSLQAPTTLGGDGSSATTSGSSTSGSGLITSSPDVTEGRLASFSRFESKDPFSQQVKTASAASTGSASTSGSTSGGTTGSGSGSYGSGSSGSGSSSTGTSPSPTTAVISVNGTLTAVTVGSDFPEASTSDPNAVPLFHLVSLTATTAKISIAGGSYTSGAGTVTLRVNKPVTLMNTADGSRYKLILKPQGTPIPGEGGTGTGTGTGTATGTGTPTSTVTLPAPSP